MAGWHHQLNGCESDQTLGDGEGQGSLACCSPRDHKESDTTERLNHQHQTMADAATTGSEWGQLFAPIRHRAAGSPEPLSTRLPTNLPVILVVCAGCAKAPQLLLLLHECCN